MAEPVKVFIQLRDDADLDKAKEVLEKNGVKILDSYKPGRRGVLMSGETDQSTFERLSGKRIEWKTARVNDSVGRGQDASDWHVIQGGQMLPEIADYVRSFGLNSKAFPC